ncbi:MAG TPA: trigger factor [Ktedonobacterales bacterium]
MNVAVERTSPNEALVTADVTWAEIEKASDKAYRRLAQQYTIPGFRKGHAPRSILEHQIGTRTIYSEALNDVVDDVYRQVIKEHGLTPVAQPIMDAPDFDEGQPFSFTLRIPVQAEITIGDYKALRVPVEPVTVGDDEVQTVIDRMQAEATQWEPVDRPAQVEDQVTVDLKLTVNEKVVNDLKDHEFEIMIERPGIYAGLDDHIVGMREGESAQFTTKIPDDYAHPDYAGQEAHYELAVKAVKQKLVPELDDEFAKERVGLDNMETVREVVQQQLQVRKEIDQASEQRDKVVRALLDVSTVEPHQAQVDAEVDLLLHENEHALEHNGLTLDQYLEITKKSRDDYKADLAPDARDRVRRDIVLNEIADREQVQVSDTELQRWLDENTRVGGRAMRLKSLTSTQRTTVTARVRREKALNLVMGYALAGEAGAGDEMTTDVTGSETEQSVEGSPAAAEAEITES